LGQPLEQSESTAANASYSFGDVAVLAVAACDAPIVVTSTEIDERLAPFYERTRCLPGLVTSLAGDHERRQWPPEVSFTEAAAKAGERVLDASGVDRSRIGVVIDTSVSRARLEPASAVTVHHLLGLPPGCLNFDVANACLGFVTGMHLAGVLIDSGHVDYALLVDGEGTHELYENTIEKLNTHGQGLPDLFANFATFTLGSGAAAMVLGRASVHPDGHRLLSGFSRADTSHHELCVGTLDGGTTDTRALLEAGIKLAALTWNRAGAAEVWGGRDRYIFHQVSEVHTNAMIDALGVEPERVPKTFPRYGNIGPAAIPITLASVAGDLAPGDGVLCMGIGSGLNVGLIELEW
jgi:3-oxoacyl-[acyl-carrier-protein] synthase-3